jgi:hypothetical protein
MNPRDIPEGFDRVHYAMIAGTVPQYCVSHSVPAKPINKNQDESGVTLKPDECRFTAIVEFNAPKRPRAPSFFHDPKQWWVGFVQNIDGQVLYQYRNKSNLVLNAAIGPERVPCKDSGYPHNQQAIFYWAYDSGLKQFGVVDDDARNIPLSPRHPTRSDPNVRYVSMGDAPGPGNLPLVLPCKEAGDKRAVMNKEYTIGWTDPLDPNRGDQDIATLRRIEGRLAFKTWLTMTFRAGDWQDIVRASDLPLYYLHLFEWEVNFSADINDRLVTLGPGSGARLIRECAVHSDTKEPIVTGPDANPSGCVKFRRG